MNIVEIPERGIRVEVPASYDEMKPEQVQYLFRLYDKVSHAGLGVDDFHARALNYLLGLKSSWRTVYLRHMARWCPGIYRDKFGRIVRNLILLQERLLPFLLHEEDGKVSLDYKSVIQHLPVFEVGRRKLYGPGDLLSDVTFGEFRAAAEELGEYFKTRDERTLSRAIACLWRPERVDYAEASKSDTFDGRRAQAYNAALTERIADTIDAADPWQRMLALLWMVNCLRYIQNEDVQIYSHTVNFSPLFGHKSGTENATGIGWTGVLFSLAENRVFGTVKDVEAAGLFDVLLLMYNEHLKEGRK